MMTDKIKRLAALLLALALLLPGLSFAEEKPETEEYEETETAAAAEAVTEKDGWHFTAKGFLTGENPGDEYVLEDEKNGVVVTKKLQKVGKKYYYFQSNGQALKNKTKTFKSGKNKGTWKFNKNGVGKKVK